MIGGTIGNEGRKGAGFRGRVLCAFVFGGRHVMDLEDWFLLKSVAKRRLWAFFVVGGNLP